MAHRIAVHLALIATILLSFAIGFDTRNAAAVDAAPPQPVLYLTHYVLCGRVVYQQFLLDGQLYGATPGTWARHPAFAMLEAAVPKSIVHQHILDVSNISGVRCA